MTTGTQGHNYNVNIYIHRWDTGTQLQWRVTNMARNDLGARGGLGAGEKNHNFGNLASWKTSVKFSADFIVFWWRTISKLWEEVKCDIVSRIKAVQMSFRKYFSERNSEESWISNPSDQPFFDQATSLPISDKEAFNSPVLAQRTFSSYAFIKIKHRNRLDTAPD